MGKKRLPESPECNISSDLRGVILELSPDILLKRTNKNRKDITVIGSLGRHHNCFYVVLQEVISTD